MMHHSIQHISCFLFGALTLLSCSNKAPEESATEPHNHTITLNENQISLAEITFGSLSEREVEYSVLCNGEVDAPPENRASVTTAFGGYISYTRMYAGEKVVKGQLLARIQDPVYIELQQSYLNALSKAEFLKEDLKRKSELRESESVSEKTFKESKRDNQLILIEADALESKLRLAGISPEGIQKNGVQNEVSVLAPISGYVTKTNINLGKHMQAGEELFEIINPDHMHIELSVYSSDIGKLKNGQKVYYRIAGSDEEQTGFVKLINKALDENTRTIVIHVHPDKDDERLLVGTFIQARIVYEKRSEKVLPFAGVVKSGDGYLAYRKVDGGVEEIFFNSPNAGREWISAPDLPEGDYVLTGAARLLRIEADEH
jgi:cobalt-zinc-cadmium efflux system membrane fusion protein